MPARSARSTPPVPSRSAPTASTRNGAPASTEASIRAWRLLPEPETRTTSPSGSEAVGTGSVWHGAPGLVGRPDAQRRSRQASRTTTASAPMASSRSRARNSRPVGAPTAESRNCPAEPPATRSSTARASAATVQADRATASFVRSLDRRATSARARRATKAPTATTTSTDSAVNHGKSPGCGSAASTGTIGSSPPFEPDQSTEPPSTTRNPGPAMNDTAHSARFGSDATWARASTTLPRPPAATAVEMVVTWFQERATIARTTRSPTPSSTPAPRRPGRTARRTESGSHGIPSRGPSTSGSSWATGRRARTSASSGTTTTGSTSDRGVARNGPETASPTAPATATAYPAHHAPRAAARGRGRVPCQCSPSVDTSTIASRAPSQATPTSSARPSSGTTEMVTSPTARFAPDTRSHSAAPVPAACHPSPLDSGSTSQASTTGATTTTSEVSPVSTPTIAPRHQGDPSGGSTASPEGSSEPGRTERRRSLTDITTSVRDNHPSMAEPRRHPDKTKPESRQRRAKGRAGSSREVCGRWMGLAGARPSASEGVRMGASAHHPAADRGGDHGERQRRSESGGEPLHDLAHQVGGLGGRPAHLDPGGLEGLLLPLRGARRAGHDGAGVAHGLALGSGEPGDVADDRLGDVVLDVGRRTLLGVATDLADHDDRVGVGVVLERLEAVDVRGADDRVAADADAGGEPVVTHLVHHLVGQRARLRDQADPAGAGDVGGDDAGVGRPGADQAGAVRADDPRRALLLGVVVELRGVLDGDALGDDHGERDAGVDRLGGGGLGEGGRHEDDADVGAGGLHRLGDGAEHGHRGAALELDGGARLARVDAADDRAAGAQHRLGVLHALGAGHALDDDLGVCGEEDGHGCRVSLRARGVSCRRPAGRPCGRRRPWCPR